MQHIMCWRNNVAVKFNISIFPETGISHRMRLDVDSVHMFRVLTPVFCSSCS